MRFETSRRRFLARGTWGLGLLAWWGLERGAQGQDVGDAADEPKARELARRAVQFLRTRQGNDGGWSTMGGPGITGLIVTALLRTGQVRPADPVITRALAYLESQMGPNGGFSEGPQANYATAIALTAFSEANVDGRYDGVIASARDFLLDLQWDEGEDKNPDDPFYGGAGYGRLSRPDLSNTSFFIEALRESGLPEDDPNLQKALVFVSRCQNLDSEFNDQPWAGQVNDGGFIYTPAGGGVSMAGETPDGGLRSYASMTYAGFKSLLYAGLTRDDPRVQAAYTWIRKHYTLDENPGMGQQGLYYYYQAFAKALAALGDPTIIDDEGQEHDWRADLIDALAERQNPDGSWVNPADRWMEGDPNLVTAYGLLALSYARPTAS